jgi:radical SAM superfamily enzyme YgiQ (UPF0313 family)
MCRKEKSVGGDMKQSDNTLFRILLVTSHNTGDIGLYDAPPLGLFRLKYYLNKNDIECDILDLSIDVKEPILEKIKRGMYKVIGLSVSHFSMEEDLDFLWEIKRICIDNDNKSIIVAGGQEATLNYKEWLKAGVEYIITGFGEKVLYNFCKNLIVHGDKNEENMKLEGLIFKDKNRIVNNPAKILTNEEFSELSYENMVKIDIPYRKYWEILSKRYVDMQINSSKFRVENIRLYTTSHCPRKCGFCSSQSFISESQQKNSKIYMLSAEQIFNLIINGVQKYGAKSFLFSDDDFLIGNREGINRIIKLCEKIIAAKTRKEIPENVIFNCQARIADFLIYSNNEKNINLTLIELLAKAGFQTFGLGVETFSDRLLKSESINKIGVNRNDCINVLDSMLAGNLVPQINIIIGIPESTETELLDTIKIAVDYTKKGCLIAVTNRIFVVPGSPLYYNKKEIAHIDYRENPFTHEKIEITRYAIPYSDILKKVVNNLEKVAKIELKGMVTNTKWETSTPPKLIVCLSYFAAITKILDDTELHNYIYRIYNYIKKEE